jgi:hypothetical protein
MLDDDEAHGFQGQGQSGEQIARTRDNDRKMSIDEDLMAWLQKNKVEPKRFSDVLK